MSRPQPCTGYLPNTIAISPRKQSSTSCNSITPILRSGWRMRPHRYQGARRSWHAFMNANNKTSRMATTEVEEERAMELTHAYEEMTPESVRQTGTRMGPAFASKRWIVAADRC